MNLSELKKLIKLFENSKISELELDQDGSKVVLKKDGGLPAPLPLAPAPTPIHTHVVAPSIAESALPGVGEDHEEGGSKYRVIAAPMVGTFYRSPSPTAPPFLEEGDSVQKGQVLCIIEAMKLMNEIDSEITGKIIKIFPESGTPVEFGEPLFEVEPE